MVLNFRHIWRIYIYHDNLLNFNLKHININKILKNVYQNVK